MQQLLRGESRARRVGSLEERSTRSHRSRTSSAAELSTYGGSLRRVHVGEALYRISDAFALFVAVSLCQQRVHPPIFAVIFIACVATATISAVIARPSVIALKATFSPRRRPFVILLGALMLLRALLLFTAVSSLGAGRSLIAVGGDLPITGSILASGSRASLVRSCASPAPLFAIAALTLISYDASGHAFHSKRGELLKKKMLNSHANRVVQKSLKKLGKSVSRRLPSLRNRGMDGDIQEDIPFGDDSLRVLDDQGRPVKSDGERVVLTRESNQIKGHPRRPLNVAHVQNKMAKKSAAAARKADKRGNGGQHTNLNVSKRVSRRALAMLDEKELSSGSQRGNSESAVPANGTAQEQPGNNSTGTASSIAVTQSERKQRDFSAGTAHGEAGSPANDASATGVDPGAMADGSRAMFLWTAVIIAARILTEASNALQSSLAADVGNWPTVMTLVAGIGLMLQCPFLLASYAGWLPTEWTSLDGLELSNVVSRGIVFGGSLFLAPAFLLGRAHSAGSSAASCTQNAWSSASIRGAEGASLFRLTRLRLEYCGRNSCMLYICLLAAFPMYRLIGSSFLGVSDEVGVISVMAALTLVLATCLEAKRIHKACLQRDSPSTSAEAQDQPERGVSFGLSPRAMGFHLIRSAKSLIAQSRANKASRQVLSFLLLQGGMMLMESVYAALSGKSGLILISADNFFCCVALGMGMYAIKLTSAKPSAMYTYGMMRYESLCGFANGLLLVYVAVLVVLEAIERQLDSNGAKYAHTFTVCLFGIVGNVAGLVFFPPESRRENHNVQGIYLHIWGNTLAFIGVGLSAILTNYSEGRLWFGASAAIIMALVMIATAIPLIVRSSRLLLLRPPLARRAELAALQCRIEQIDGVTSVSSLRAWNLTPTCLVASVRITVSVRSSLEETDILFKVRSLLASVGVPPSEATIQISNLSHSGSKSAGIHKRERSAGGVIMPELEGLYIQSGGTDTI